jgi:hypothetical protein
MSEQFERPWRARFAVATSSAMARDGRVMRPPKVVVVAAAAWRRASATASSDRRFRRSAGSRPALVLAAA